MLFEGSNTRGVWERDLTGDVGLEFKKDSDLLARGREYIAMPTLEEEEGEYSSLRTEEKT